MQFDRHARICTHIVISRHFRHWTKYDTSDQTYPNVVNDPWHFVCIIQYQIDVLKNSGGVMKYVTLEAGETKDGKKVIVAKQEMFPIAETIADILDMVNRDNGWNEEEIVAAFNYGSRVKRQTQLRAQNEGPSTLKTFKALSQAKQEEILRAHGLI